MRSDTVVTEKLQKRTGVTSEDSIDLVAPQARFYELHDIGTGPLSGGVLLGDGAVVAACKEVCPPSPRL